MWVKIGHTNMTNISVFDIWAKYTPFDIWPMSWVPSLTQAKSGPNLFADWGPTYLLSYFSHKHTSTKLNGNPVEKKL